MGSALARAGRIAFDVDEARNYLLKNGFVYTLRWQKRASNFEKNVRAQNQGVTFALVSVQFVKEMDLRNASELEKYAKNSGFESMAEWLKRARKFWHSRSTRSRYLYLYRVCMEKEIGVGKS